MDKVIGLSEREILGIASAAFAEANLDGGPALKHFVRAIRAGLAAHPPAAEGETPRTNAIREKWKSAWIGLIAREALDLSDQLERELAALRKFAGEQYAKLPEEMKNCTILFNECEKGHGRLTATNWVQHECPICAREQAEARAEAAESAIERVKAINPNRYSIGAHWMPHLVWEAAMKAINDALSTDGAKGGSE